MAEKLLPRIGRIHPVLRTWMDSGSFKKHGGPLTEWTRNRAKVVVGGVDIDLIYDHLLNGVGMDQFHLHLYGAHSFKCARKKIHDLKRVTGASPEELAAFIKKVFSEYGPLCGIEYRYDQQESCALS